MFNVGGPEVLVILVVALLVLGPAKLPEAARQMGSLLGRIRELSAGFQSEMRSALEEPTGPTKPVSDGGPTAVDDGSTQAEPGTAGGAIEPPAADATDPTETSPPPSPPTADPDERA
jgi:Tat protein translocase TatB subunit